MVVIAIKILLLLCGLNIVPHNTDFAAHVYSVFCNFVLLKVLFIFIISSYYGKLNVKSLTISPYTVIILLSFSTLQFYYIIPFMVFYLNTEHIDK